MAEAARKLSLMGILIPIKGNLFTKRNIQGNLFTNEAANTNGVFYSHVLIQI